MPVAALLGTGLIGASIGIGLRSQGWIVVGWDPDEDAGKGAIRCGAVDRLAPSVDQAMTGADLVVLAGPPVAIEDQLRSLDTEVLITDVAGVKAPMVVAGRHLKHFVAGHPMAGRESSGPAGASGSLFRGATWVLCTDNAHPADLAAIEAIVTGTGSDTGPDGLGRS